MTDPAIALLMFAALFAVIDWRQGLALCVLVGVAQDPLRKLAPNQPVYYIVLVGVIFGVAWLRASYGRVRLGPSVIQGWQRELALPFTLFVVLVLAQATHSYAVYGSLRMTGIGLLAWLAPIPAVMLAYQFAIRRGMAGLRRFMLFYCFVALISLTGVYLEYAGFTWPALGEVGEGIIIYDVGVALRAYAGFFRSSEIAAWHAAAIACFAFILSTGRRMTLVRIFVGLGLMSVLITLGLLTGRRKMLVEVTVFVATYLFLVAWIQRGAARLAAAVLIAGAVGYVAIVGFVAPDLVDSSYTKRLQMENADKFQGYATRGQSVFVDLPSRVSELGVQPVLWAVDNFGWLGAGLGTGSQGTQDLAERFGINRGAAEGGIGKITMELGVPGLLLSLWSLMALARHVRRKLVALAKISLPHARLAFGLVAFLVANVATFSVATQAYSDLFVLLMLGWSLGFVLALPVLAARAEARKLANAQAGASVWPAAGMHSPPQHALPPGFGPGRG